MSVTCILECDICHHSLLTSYHHHLPVPHTQSVFYIRAPPSITLSTPHSYVWGEKPVQKALPRGRCNSVPAIQPCPFAPPSHTASRHSFHSQPPDDSNAASRIITPVPSWSFDRLNKEFFDTLTYMQVREISTYGAAALWEVLQVNDMADDWT